MPQGRLVRNACVAAATQEFLLERLIHGLRDLSPSGDALLPGFEGFGLLPGRCCADDARTLRCMQLCLDAQWLAWRAAQQQPPQPQQHDADWADAAGGGGAPGSALELPQLFELTRQVAEQGMAVVAEGMATQDGGDNGAPREEEEEGERALQGPAEETLQALATCASCLSDLQFLWPGLGSVAEMQAQLPLVLALAANTLAFSVQGLDALPVEELEEEEGQGRGGPGGERGGASQSGAPPPPPQWPSLLPGAQQQRQQQGGQRAFGRGAAAVAPGPALPAGAAAAGGGQPRAPSRARRLRDALERSVAVLAFLFPLSREGAELVGPLASLYAPHAWLGMAEQAGGALGALEMALRSGRAALARTPSLNAAALQVRAWDLHAGHSLRSHCSRAVGMHRRRAAAATCGNALDLPLFGHLGGGGAQLPGASDVSQRKGARARAHAHMRRHDPHC